MSSDVTYFMNENWKPIKGYNGLYLISESGKVFSKKSNKLLKLFSLKQSWGNKPYLYVILCSGVSTKHMMIHKLVITHFVSEPPFEGAVVRHIDNNILNNHYTNLQWGTFDDNIHDRLDNQNDIFVYITKQQVIDIKNDLLNGASYKEIKEKYNIKQSLVQRIASNNAWKLIGPDMSEFNYAEKQSEKKRKINIDEFTQDYINNDTMYVMKKYNLTKFQVSYFVRSHNISKLPLPKIDEKTLQSLIKDFLEYDMQYVISKYNMSKKNIQRLLHAHNIKKNEEQNIPEEIQQIIDDYIQYDRVYVANKYEKTIKEIENILRKYHVRKRAPKKTYEDLKPLFDDYIEHDLKYVVEKYNLTEVAIRHYIDRFHIKKERKTKTLEEIQPMIDDYLKNGLQYVVDNYDMSKSTILRYFSKYNIHRPRWPKIEKSNINE